MKSYFWVSLVKASSLSAFMGCNNVTPIPSTTKSMTDVVNARLNPDGSYWIDCQNGDQELVSYEDYAADNVCTPGFHKYEFKIEPVGEPLDKDVIDILSSIGADCIGYTAAVGWNGLMTLEFFDKVDPAKFKEHVEGASRGRFKVESFVYKGKFRENCWLQRRN